jgi:drug/metabolite transporter (DMT)-like permease
MNHQPNALRVYGLALLLVTYWPLSYPLTKIGIQYFSPEGFCALRCVLAASVMVFYALLRKFPLPARADIPRILLCGALGVSGFIYFICIASNSSLSAGTVSFLVAVNPLYVLAYSWVTGKEAFTRNALLGSMLSIAGVAMLTIYRSGMQVEVHSLYALLSGACFAGYLVLQKPLVGRYHMERLGTYTTIAGGITLLPLAIMHGGELAHAPFWPAEAVMLFMAIASTCIAFIIWAYLMTHLSQIQTASLGYMLPFSASVSSIFILGEMLPLSSWLGGGLILLGMVAINWHRFKRQIPSAA